MNIKKIVLTTLLIVSTNSLFAAPAWVSTTITTVYAGYPDDSVAFQTAAPAQNPAGCADVGVYFIPNDHDAKSALAVLLSAKLNNLTVGFSVRDDVCHTIDQLDSSAEVPVIQRIGLL